MKSLFIGHCNYGSTSLMRYNELCKITGEDLHLINITPEIERTPKFFKSIGWRFKLGPLIFNINRIISDFFVDNNSLYPFVWIEKGVFIKPSVLKLIKSHTKLLIHYTPDPAFLYHKSRFFNKSVVLYDVCITTKTFEIDLYYKYRCNKLIYSTQGFDEDIHKIYFDFKDKIYDVCFIGHFEKNRASVVQNLLDNDLKVALAGIKWENFVKMNKGNPNLFYFGSNIIGVEYAKLISQSRIGLGLLSSWIPELHTTRTFEIPACGTALLTVKNSELVQFFNLNEVIYVDSEQEILSRIVEVNRNVAELCCLSQRGFNKVTTGGFSYTSIMADLMNQIYTSCDVA